MNAPKIIRSDDLKVENRYRILTTLRSEESVSRAQIGKLTGLSQSALSLLLRLMIEQGIVSSESESVPVQKRGRPKTAVTLEANAAHVVTVALTINQLRFCLVNYAGITLSQTTVKIATLSLDKEQLVQAISSGISNAIKPLESKTLRAISIGFEGVADVLSGELLWSPILSVDKLPIGDALEQVFRVPVSVNNDCGLIAKALHSQKHELLGDSFAAVLFSHSIGLGVYLAGEPFTGAHSSTLELGHLQFEKNGALCRCGKRGCIEAYATDYGLQRSVKGDYSAKIPEGSISVKDMNNLICAACDNAENELQAFKQAGKAIGFGLSTLFTILAPLPIALIGYNNKTIELMRPDIEAALQSVGHNTTDYSNLLHCFPDATPLFMNGLVLDAMSIVDRSFAEDAFEIREEKLLGC